MPITSEKVKAMIYDLGADLCGIAPEIRFKKAPNGFRPTDIYDRCRSVIVFAKRLPLESINASSCVPYTQVNSTIMKEVDILTLRVSVALENRGIKNVLVPTDDPYEHWESDRSYGRAILSLRHAGYLSGLGVLGRNTLLMNNEFGNMIQIGAVLASTELPGDTIAQYQGCPEDCSICLDSCPAGALDGKTVDQKLCRPYSNFVTQKGYILKKCYICRRICPHFDGIK